MEVIFITIGLCSLIFSIGAFIEFMDPYIHYDKTKCAILSIVFFLVGFGNLSVAAYLLKVGIFIPTTTTQETITNNINDYILFTEPVKVEKTTKHYPMSIKTDDVTYKIILNNDKVLFKTHKEEK